MIILFVLTTCAAFGQENLVSAETGEGFTKYWPALTVFLMVCLVGSLIISFTKLLLDAWLRNKIIEKELTEKFMTEFMHSQKESSRQQALKWTLILFGLSVGLVLLDFVSSLHEHAFSVLSIALAISFLSYFLLLRKSE